MDCFLVKENMLTVTPTTLTLVKEGQNVECVKSFDEKRLTIKYLK